MKKIDFSDKRASVVYNDYMLRVEQMTIILSPEDRNEILMELNSHIYESMQGNSSVSELDKLIDTLEKLGAPEKTLAPLVADKKLNQATQTFNPVHIIKALSLNIANGVSYIVFSVLYVLLGACSLLILLKLIYPQNTGVFLSNGTIHSIGFISDISDKDNLIEVTGWYFIPLVVIFILVAYCILTGLLRLKRKFN